MHTPEIQNFIMIKLENLAISLVCEQAMSELQLLHVKKDEAFLYNLSNLVREVYTHANYNMDQLFYESANRFRMRKRGREREKKRDREGKNEKEREVMRERESAHLPY